MRKMVPGHHCQVSIMEVLPFASCGASGKPFHLFSFGLDPLSRTCSAPRLLGVWESPCAEVGAWPASGQGRVSGYQGDRAEEGGDRYAVTALPLPRPPPPRVPVSSFSSSSSSSSRANTCSFCPRLSQCLSPGPSQLPEASPRAGTMVCSSATPLRAWPGLPLCRLIGDVSKNSKPLPSLSFPAQWR